MQKYKSSGKKNFSVEVDRTFLKMCAENLVKVTIIGEVMSRKKGTFPSSSAVKIALSKHVVLIMRIIIIIIINIDDIRQERPNEGPILKLNKRLK